MYSGGNSTTTDYHYLNGALMYESVNGETTVNYLRSADGRLLGEQLEQNGVHIPYYYHYDAAGDVIAVTDQNGSLYRQYVYDPYGNVISVKDGNGNAVDINHDAGFNHAYTYRGYRYDQESGLYFLNSRYYQAGTGSFLTKDTVKGDPQDSRTLNRYAYTSGDPVNYFDPDGHGMVMNDDGTGPVVYSSKNTAGNTSKEDVDPNTPPPSSSGYVAPKVKGELKQQKAANGQKGWPDKWGNIWVPVPSNKSIAHGGGQWDVQYPNGGYDNVYPKGYVRAGHGPRGRFSPPGARITIGVETGVGIGATASVEIGAGVIIYLIISEGSRVFLLRNLIPIP